MRISSILARISQRVQHLLSIKIIHSFFWVFLGNGGQQGIRLIGNLILTRILYPELFGIMALATAVMVGLGQISDIGLRPGVIKSNRTEDPEFMGTAWTLQILKTTVIFLFALIIAYPIANMYKEPVLAPIIMLFGLSIFVKGFRSIALL
ncbi:MAG: O-antigen/teichoic acid export membrane protein, partial [Lentisphaeria bacterium]